VTSTPAPGNEPRPADGTLAPTAPGTPPTTATPLTRTQKILIGVVVIGVLTIATLGFIGSYNAVTELAKAKQFGKFSHAFPIAIDAGIIAFLALDLLLTWLRMPYPMLRHGAWLLTAATICFNAAAAWPDKLGVSMHAVIPVLFVIAVEAARHAIGRIADITADKHIESPPIARWILNPVGTFLLWRRTRLWSIRKWDTALDLEQQRRIYRAKLRKEYGRTWRRKATAEQLLVLKLTLDGMSVTEALALPAKEAEKERQEQERILREQQTAADERRREQEDYQREQQRLEDERIAKAEDERLQREREAHALEQQRLEDARAQRIADAEANAQLAEIERRKQQAQDEDNRRRRQEQIDHAKRMADEQERAAQAARAQQNAEEAARLEAEKKEAASRRAASLLANASASPAPASANRPPATSVANASASEQSATASPATASRPANATKTASASATQTPSASATASAVDIDNVVATYQLLAERDGKAPSDQSLGEALGVSRSRAQQLRTLAINAGHGELAKPVRLAS